MQMKSTGWSKLNLAGSAGPSARATSALPWTGLLRRCQERRTHAADEADCEHIPATRAAIGPHSPVAVLDALLAHSGTVSHDRSHLGEFRSQLGLQAFEKPSGRPDLNRRPLDPQPCIPIPPPGRSHDPAGHGRAQVSRTEPNRAVASAGDSQLVPSSSWEFISLTVLRRQIQRPVEPTEGSHKPDAPWHHNHPESGNCGLSRRG